MAIHNWHLAMAVSTVVLVFLVSAAGATLPRIIPAQDNRTFKMKDNINLKCVVDANVAEIELIDWYIGTEKLRDGDHPRISTVQQENYSVLLITEAQSSDADVEYICKVTFQGGRTEQASATISLNPVIEFVDAPVVQNPEETSNAHIKCETKGGEGLLISWKRNGKRIIDNTDRKYRFQNDNQVLIIPKYTKDLDDGIYTCIAMQPNTGEFKQRQITVVGHTSPNMGTLASTTGKEGESTHLYCNCSGFPEPTATWFKDHISDANKIAHGGRYSLSGDTLTINELSEKDTGTYVCKAKNNVGEVSGSAELKVFLKPRLTLKPSHTARRDAPFQIKCDVQSISDSENVTMFWTRYDRDGTPFPVIDEAEISVKQQAGSLTLDFHPVSEKHAGRYKCKATNDGGEAVSETILKVEKSPTVVADKYLTVKGVIGHFVTFRCEFDAVPSAEVVWKGPSGATLPETKLESQVNGFSQVKFKPQYDYEFGNYTCSGSNGVSPDGQAVRKLVQVMKPPRPRMIENSVQPSYVNVSVAEWTGLKVSMQVDRIVARLSERGDSIPENPHADDLPVYDEAQVTYIPGDNIVKVGGLKANTKYVFVICGVNLAGPTEFSEPIEIETTDPEAPEQPHFQVIDDKLECPSEGECHVSWNPPEHMGSELLQFKVRYIEVGSDPAGDWETIFVPASLHTMDVYDRLDLKPKTVYNIEMFAQNAVGLSVPARLQLTTSNAKQITQGSNTGSTAVAAIIIIFILLAVVIIDVFFYRHNQCGVTMFICVRFCGKQSTTDKALDIEGGADEGVSYTGVANGEKEPEDKDPIHTETTPMISDRGTLKNTDV